MLGAVPTYLTPTTHQLPVLPLPLLRSQADYDCEVWGMCEWGFGMHLHQPCMHYSHRNRLLHHPAVLASCNGISMYHASSASYHPPRPAPRTYRPTPHCQTHISQRSCRCHFQARFLRSNLGAPPTSRFEHMMKKLQLLFTSICCLSLTSGILK